jgi:hypothetical protein
MVFSRKLQHHQLDNRLKKTNTKTILKTREIGIKVTEKEVTVKRTMKLTKVEKEILMLILLGLMERMHQLHSIIRSPTATPG